MMIAPCSTCFDTALNGACIGWETDMLCVVQTYSYGVVVLILAIVMFFYIKGRLKGRNKE